MCNIIYIFILLHLLITAMNSYRILGYIDDDIALCENCDILYSTFF